MSTIRRRPSRAEQRDQTRQDLLAAAADTIARSGYHATTLDAVASTAGVTKGSVYHNFSSKEELFLAVLQLRAAPDAMADSFRRLLDRKQGVDQDFLLLLIEFWAYAVRTGSGRAQLARGFAEARRSMKAVVADLGDEIDDETAAMLLAADLGMSLQAVLAPRSVTTATCRRMIERLLRKS